jgi:hypothetical protein
MVMAGTGITGTIAVSKKITQSSRSRPLLSRHLTVSGTFLFQDCCNGGDRLTVSCHAAQLLTATGALLKHPRGLGVVRGGRYTDAISTPPLPWSTNVWPCAARIPDGRATCGFERPVGSCCELILAGEPVEYRSRRTW